MVITALKGKWLLFAAGWLTVGTVWLIAAFLPVQPGSWWDRRFHGAADREVAETVE